MKINIFLIITFLLFLGCSSKDDINSGKSINIFENKNALTILNNNESQNSSLDLVVENKSIQNAKSYNLTNSLIKFPLEKIWEINTNQIIDDKNPYLPDPIFLLSNLFLLNNQGTLFKIDADTGKTMWKMSIFKDMKNTIIGTPALSGVFSGEDRITLYAHNGNDEIIAIDGINGKIIWKRNHNLPFRGGITSSKNFILVNDFDGNLLSIDGKNGKNIWSVLLGSEYSSIYTSARPIIAKNKIIVPGTGGAFFVISSINGDVIWSENISSNKQLPKIFHTGDIIANPIYNEGIIYIVSQSGFTAAFDINTSEELWTIPIGGLETPTLSGKTIFVNGNMGLLAAIDITSGKLRWKINNPSYTNENSFFYEKEIAIYKGPTLVDSKILFSNSDGIINIIDANMGKEIGTLKLDRLALSPIPVEKKIFFLTENGKLLAYE